jgi:YNFM family putative membrane transporter
MFAAGLATFALLYTTQPLLPLLSRELDVSPATSSLTLAATTFGLALALLPAGWLSDAWGRTRVMKLSLLHPRRIGLGARVTQRSPGSSRIVAHR